MPALADNTTRVELDTTLGKIVLELNQAKAPNTVANFLSYVDDGFYNGT
ncbi:MAG: peptidylprolyl isomerase, partial [Alcanivoracaceae bacterium]|nr:peptidylprolyl isomerase [Alcanivoracaceae bacterium]